MILAMTRRGIAALHLFLLHIFTAPHLKAQTPLRLSGRYLPILLLASTLLTGLLTGLSSCRHGQRASETGPDLQQQGRGGDGFPRTVRDGSGDKVTIKARPSRIVSQTLGTDEVLWAICSHERIVGVSRFGPDPRYSPIADEVKAANITTVLNAEEILQLQPDLIFVASYSRAETVESVKTSGATVFRFANFDSIESIQQNIRMVARAIGEESSAEKLITRMGDELAAVRARIPAGVKPPRVLSYSPSGNTAGAETSFDSILRATGAVNVAAENGLRGFPKISAEQVTVWQPDFIVTGAEPSKSDSVRKRLLDDPVIATTAAARGGRIVVLDNRYLLTVSHHITRAVSDLADAIYSVKPRGTPE
ncbi:MAG: ABC transporter substrate-binding protein [Acidobacteria bacterium]|nr:ABC transporter substrate-binding protein [Acidobacteriota bacterium]